MFDAAGVAQIASDRRAARHLHHDRCGVFPTDIAMDFVCLTIELLDFAKEEACDVENVRPHIRENELFQIFEKRLIFKNGETVAVIDPRAEDTRQCERTPTCFLVAE